MERLDGMNVSRLMVQNKFIDRKGQWFVENLAGTSIRAADVPT